MSTTSAVQRGLTFLDDHFEGEYWSGLVHLGSLCMSNPNLCLVTQVTETNNYVEGLVALGINSSAAKSYGFDVEDDIFDKDSHEEKWHGLQREWRRVLEVREAEQFRRAARPRDS